MSVIISSIQCCAKQQKLMKQSKETLHRLETEAASARIQMY